MKEFLNTFLRHGTDEGYKALLWVWNHSMCLALMQEFVRVLPDAIALKAHREVRLPSGARIILRYGPPEYARGYSVAQVGVERDQWTDAELAFFASLVRRMDGGPVEGVQIVDFE